MAAGKILFATTGAFWSVLASSALAAGAPAAVPLPVARPADLDKAQPSSLPDTTDAPSTAKAAEDAKQGGDGLSDLRDQYKALLQREVAKTGLPYDIADAVAAIESGYDPSVIGSVGEIGLMQVRPETAATLGFRGDASELAKPDVNIRYGVAYLSEAWRLADGDVCRALMKYRAGHNEEQMSALSASYCGRARAHLVAVGSPLAASVSVPAVADLASTSADPVLAAARRAQAHPPRVRTAAVSQAFWAAEEARASALRRRVEAKWRRMASR